MRPPVSTPISGHQPDHFLRFGIVILTALGFIFLGLFLRSNARSWSRDVVSHPGPGLTMTESFSDHRFALMQDGGAVCLGFGTLLLGGLAYRWIAVDV